MRQIIRRKKVITNVMKNVQYFELETKMTNSIVFF